MKRFMMILLSLALLALSGCAGRASGEALDVLTPGDAAALVKGDGEAVWLFVTNVGKGDALVLRLGDWIGLIDTGKTWARGRVDAALGVMGSNAASALDALFLTHTDDDHTGGLKWMAEESSWLPARNVDAVYASAMYTGKEKKHPAVKTYGNVQWLRRGDAVPLGDATLKVLAPVSLHEDEDDNSLVMLLESDQGKILLTGDMEAYEEAELLAQGDDLKCDVLKVPNHGDDDATGPALANACAAPLALISTDSQEKPGTPDPGVVSRLQAAGGRVLVTQDSELGILVRLKGGEATAWSVDFWETNPAKDLYIASLDAEDDRIILGNRSEKPVGLGLCYLYSEKGDELFVLPDGASVDPGQTITVGTNSTKGSYDVLWPDKKVINKKKTDAIRLYDSVGRLIDRVENGK